MTRYITPSSTSAFSRELAALDGFLDDIVGSRSFRSILGDLTGLTVPCTETAEAYIIELPLPGFKRENITLQVSHEASEGVELTMVGVRNGRKLERTVVVGDHRRPVDASNITSRLEDGILTITCPKRAAAKPRTIPVA